jgi:hypothetical protein
MSLTRAQKIGLLLFALLVLVGIVWALDWETNSGFWRGFWRILFEIVGHLGK